MIGTSLANRYELHSELGRGGMGVVYRARDPLLQREVAVKVLDVSTLSVTSEERFRREAQLVAQMDHPAIVPIYDVGRHENSLFFVMPVVQGTTVHTLIREGALELGEILEIVAQVAEALDYSHAQGVIHRDVKPENIMVAREEGGPEHPSAGRLRVRVMDFGLARGAASRLTKTGNLPGTLSYLSPEQITATEIDGRSDLYSLGTILYECLVGKPPFSGTRYALLYRIAHEPPPPLAGRGIDKALEGIALRTLAKDPAGRPQRGNELAALLRSYAEGLDESGRSEAGRSEARAPERSPGGRDQPPLILPMLGRQRELAELERRLSRALAGECQFVVIAGEAGMGKTRLLQELESMARSRGILVLRGHFSDQENAFPYQGFGELVQDYFRSREVSPEGEALPAGGPDLEDLAADLEALFPVLTEIPAIRDAAAGAAQQATPGLGPGVNRGDRSPLFELLARTLIRLAAGQPMVLLLEHLHGTEASIEALQYVVRRLGPTPTLVVGTYRQTEISKPHPLVRMLKSFQDDPRFRALVLEPLGPSEHRQQLVALIGSPRVTDELTEKLYEASEGNPFFTQELVRSLVETGDVSQDGTGSWTLSSETAILADSLPETIQQAVESRLDRYPEELERILSMASILGKSFDFEDLQALVEAETGDEPKALDEAIDQLIRDGILIEEPMARGDTLQFSSGVVRDVLHGNLSRRQRRSLHRKHAQQLELRYVGRLERIYPRLVHHFAAGDVGAKTVEYALKLALSSMDSFAPEAAVQAIRTALEFAEDDEVAGGGGVEGELRLLLAKALRTGGNVEAAHKESARAARVLERAGDAASAAASLVAAETAWQGRKVNEARRWVEKGIQLARAATAQAPSPSSTETLRKLLTLGATVANLRGEYLKAKAHLEEADRLAPPAPDGPGEEPIPDGGTLVVALSNPLTTLDPVASLGVEDAEVLGNVFEPLLAADGAGNLTALLGSSWEASPDGTRFRVTLRPDVRFSDGTPLSAREVKRAIEGSARRGRSNLPAAFAVLAGMDDFLAGETEEVGGIEVRAEHLLEFHLVEPLLIFPALLTDLTTAVARPTAGDAVQNPGELVGTGRFRIRDRDAQRVIVERNPDAWHARRPHLDRIEFRTSLEAAAIAAGLRSGEIDLGRDLLPENLEEMLRDPRLRPGLVEATATNVYFVLFNHDGPSSRQLELRQALTGVVHPRDIVWRTLGRFAQPATCLLPPGILGHDPGRRRSSLAPEEALHRLRSAGLTPPLRLRAVVHPLFLDRYASLTRALLDAWSAIGVEVEIGNASLEEYLAHWDERAGVDLLLARWIPNYDDPDSFTYAMLHSRLGPLAGYLGSRAAGSRAAGSRATGSSEADQLFERARQEARPAVRETLYRKIETLLAEQAMLLPLFHDTAYRIANPRVRGLRLLTRPPYVDYPRIGKLPRTAPAGEHSAAAPRGATIRVPLPTPLDSLDPSMAYRPEHGEVIPNVFETLTRVDEGAHIVPHLAAEFSVEEGSRRFRFRLHDNIRFHDGRKLTARDVRYSLERLLRSPQAGGDAAMLPIRGSGALRAGEAAELAGFSIVSSREFVLDLEQPLSFFPAMLTNPATVIVPEGTTRFTGNWRDDCAGTGPFRLVRLAPAEGIELESNPHYWKPGYPRCDRLLFEFSDSPDGIFEDFRRRRIDIASHLHPGVAEQLRQAPEFAAGFQESPGFATYFLALNARREPFSDPALRRTLERALGVRAMVRSAVGRLGIPADGLIPPGLLGYEPQRRRPSPAVGGDSDAASEKGSFKGLEIEAAVLPSYLGEYAPVWENLCRIFSELGITVRLTSRTSGELLTCVASGRVDFIAARWTASYPDSDSFVKLFHSKGLLGTLFGDDEIDRLFEKGRTETDPALRHVIYREIEQAFARDALLIPLFHQQVYRFVGPRIRGLRLRLGFPEVAYEELFVTP